MRVIEGGVTAAKGYKAAGLRAGIKAGKTNKDMAMIYSEKEAVCVPVKCGRDGGCSGRLQQFGREI